MAGWVNIRQNKILSYINNPELIRNFVAQRYKRNNKNVRKTKKNRAYRHKINSR